MFDRIQEVAERANVPEDFVRQLVAANALPGEQGKLELARAVRRVRLFRSWTAAGLSVETILTLVNRGALSLAFLDAPVMAVPERLDRSYEQLAAERGVPLSFVQALHQSLGFAPPEPGDRAGEDDATMLEVARLFRGAGAADDAMLRLLAVYADNLRRIAKAEADYYEANIERRLRAEGLDERQLIELGTQLGDVRGIAVHAVTRIAALAQPGEVLVSAPAVGLLEGSDLKLEDAGEYELKGLPGRRRVYRLAQASADDCQ